MVRWPCRSPGGSTRGRPWYRWTDAAPGIGRGSGASPTGTPRTPSRRGLPGRSPRRGGCRSEAMVVRPYLFDHIDEVLNSVEGFQDLTQCRQASVAEEIGQHADRVIAAHWGDVWLDDAGMVGGQGVVGEDELLGHALKKFRKRGRGWLLDQICRPRLDGREPEGLLADLIRPELKAVRAIDDPDFRIKAFKTDQWSFRWTTASLRSYQLGAFPRLPFYDTRLTDFFATVPSEFVAGRRLQIDYLKRYAPDLARIAWQAGGANLYRYRSARYWKLPIRAVAKARRCPVGREGHPAQLGSPVPRRRRPPRVWNTG